MSNDYWFSQRRYGMGATPTNWKGWALVASYLVVFVATTALSDVRTHTLAAIGFGFIVSALFLYICWRKTDGGWRWRWGDDDEGSR